ncbi:MAG: hypothetical protein JJU29_20085 [Verrucomicrobia bacterium]|nr:hypothetical protein [Verrucomicrobiota bacterium]MCH8513542.1 hypothetical protein [Kiritimatiellia bacterium]
MKAAVCFANLLIFDATSRHTRMNIKIEIQHENGSVNLDAEYWKKKNPMKINQPAFLKFVGVLAFVLAHKPMKISIFLLCVIGLGGCAHPRRLHTVHGPENVQSFNVSPDGRYALWRSRDPGEGWPVPKGPYLRDNRSGEVWRLIDLIEAGGVEPPGFGRLSFSPDGAMILVGDNRRNVVFVPETGMTTIISEVDFDGISTRWVGPRVALFNHFAKPARQIELVDLTTGSKTTLPAWGWVYAASEDGRRLLIAGGTGTLDEPMSNRRFLSESRVMVIDDQGLLIRTFGAPLSNTSHLGSMSPNGAWCAFQSRHLPLAITVAEVDGNTILTHSDVGLLAGVTNDGNVWTQRDNQLQSVRRNGQVDLIAKDFRSYDISGKHIYILREGTMSATRASFP